MDDRLLIYHPLRWSKLHHPYDLNELIEEQHSSEELEESGLTQEEYLDLSRRYSDLEPAIEEDFKKGGSNIFHIQPALVEMFKNSSADDIHMKSLKLPYEAFYVYFGLYTGIRMQNSRAYIDGAYIWSPHIDDTGAEKVFFINLTESIDLDQALKANSLKRLELDVTYQLDMSFCENMDETVRQAYDDHFVNTYEKYGQEFSESIIDGWEKHKGEPGIQRIERPKSHEENIAEWKPNPIYSDPAARAAINLVFNTICYLSYEKREVKQRYPDFAPERLVGQVTSGSTKERRRGQSKLESMGYRKVYFCGDTIERRVAILRQEEVRGVSPHWRRGHWRHQAHGPGLIQRKLVWIEPVLVNDTGNEVVGHLYVAKDGKLH